MPEEVPEPSASVTANTAAPDTEAQAQTPPGEDEKRISTSRRPSLHHHGSSPVPEVAPVLGAVGWVGEPSEKAEHAATAFKHHPVEPLAQHDEKQANEEHVAQISDKEGSAGTAAPIITDGEPDIEAEGDDEIVYPGKLQLGLLTLGLCLATFTVALGTSIDVRYVVHWNVSCFTSGPRSLDRGSIELHSSAFACRC